MRRRSSRPEPPKTCGKFTSTAVRKPSKVSATRMEAELVK